MPLRVVRLLHALAGAGLLLARAAGAQVSVSPILIVLHDRTPYGAAYVINGSRQAQEVTVGVVFSHPVTDSTGQTFMAMEADSAQAAAFSLVPHLVVSPRRLVLPPGGRQTIRFAVRNAAQLPSGTRWARLVTSARPFSPFRPDSANAPTRGGIAASIGFYTPVLFRKGTVEAAPQIDSVAVAADSSHVHVRPSLRRIGNAPLFGAVHVRLFDASGAQVAYTTLPVAVYVPLAPRYTLPRTGLAPGAYTVEVEVRSERPDLPSGLQRPFAPLSRRVPLVLR